MTAWLRPPPAVPNNDIRLAYAAARVVTAHTYLPDSNFGTCTHVATGLPAGLGMTAYGADKSGDRHLCSPNRHPDVDGSVRSSRREYGAREATAFANLTSASRRWQVHAGSRLRHVHCCRSRLSHPRASIDLDGCSYMEHIHLSGPRLRSWCLIVSLTRVEVIHMYAHAGLW